jgi:4-amino-4-deoxy-L-arabinose transferase-like glycosyltransferase
MAKKTKKRSIFLILVLGLILIGAGLARFIGLGQLPSGTHCDEVSVGYNAFSIWQAGIDEWGNKYPLTFKAFGEHKLPGLPYLVALLFNFFSVSIFTVRFPSAMAGFFSIIAIYLIFKEIFSKNKILPLLGAFIFAFIPWSFSLSRQFFESNVANGFFLFGFFFLIRFIKSPAKEKFIDVNSFLAVSLFSLSGYFYIVHRLISPLILAFSLFLLFKNKKITLKKSFLAFGFFILLSLPLILQMINPEASKRLNQESQVINFGSSLEINENRAMCYLFMNKNARLSKICYLIWNKPVLRAEKAVRSYLAHFSPQFLFFEGGTTTGPAFLNYGAFFLSLIPFYFLGFYRLFVWAIKEKSILGQVFLAGLFLSPLPGSLVGQPAEHRSTIFLFFVLSLIVLGFWQTFLFLKNNKRLLNITLLLVVLLLFFETSRFLVDYFFIHTRFNASKWRYEIPILAQEVIEKEKNYDRVIFNNLAEDMILNLAFFAKIDPTYFADNVKRHEPNKYGWTHAYQLGKYKSESWGTEDLSSLFKTINQDKILLVTGPIEKYSDFARNRVFDPTGVHCLAEIYDLNYLIEKIQSNE